MSAGHERVRWLRWLDRLPIRWRLAVVSAILTGAILLLFAVGIGGFTIQRVRSDFQTQTAARFESIRGRLKLGARGRADGQFDYKVRNDLAELRGDAATVVAVWAHIGGQYILVQSSDPRRHLGDPSVLDPRVINGYRVETREINQPATDFEGRPFQLPGTAQALTLNVPLVVQVGRSSASLARTERRVETVLAFGVLFGTLMALLAGLAVGQRAMRPVKRMTGTARHIARTRDLDARMPIPPVHDEIAELARTLQDMLDELAASQARIDQSLQRQREFVADASHELRTPLTAVQANLELLALSTEGDDREAAESALRSSRRMRRLVSDLLLLARMDAQRESAREPVDLDRAILEAVDELEPQFGGHEIVLDLDPVTVDGIRDELVRMVANLLGNALRHTPDGTEIRIRLREIDGRGELVVEDDGPGIPAPLREQIFERFVRRGGEGAGSTGIGLAIVRAAAQRHGGDVRVEATNGDDDTGARFVVTVTLARDDGAADATAEIDPSGPPVAAAPEDGTADGPEPVAANADGGLLGPSRRAARQIRRRLRGTRPAAGGGDVEERLGGAAPTDDL
ncbi:periplasmic sensor signal transduction histidine kinase [Patulibacter medicamentivorans]|uniref:histidine kinase n=1 Tax=Patulibacter medicamentivorans TaxID=1097667 RepID=H0E1Y6_9ACTN|nr:HAMP domain-containing sensor histidine kinase [Patulibacter medicamentivorans]EHN12294.1 periplasmic sensor signal transduction histidine kinase [Patulibacter medicamentivorans]